MRPRGTITLFRIKGVPVRAHWSLPLGVLVFSGFRVAPGAWLGLVALIVAHELGHALLVHRAGLANLGIELSGLGGQCRFAGEPTPLASAGIAWGGVLAQLPILLIAGAVSLLVGSLGSAFLADLLYTFTWTNALLIAINLVPLSPLDGAEAWPFIPRWLEQRRRRRAWREKLSRPAPPGEADEAAAPQTLQQALRDADRRKLN